VTNRAGKRHCYSKKMTNAFKGRAMHTDIADTLGRIGWIALAFAATLIILVVLFGFV
jgi:hypothetical protein